MVHLIVLVSQATVIERYIMLADSTTSIDIVSRATKWLLDGGFLVVCAL